MGTIIASFDRMRHQRNVMEYRSYEMPELTDDEVRSDLAKASEIVDVVERLLEQMPLF